MDEKMKGILKDKYKVLSLCLLFFTVLGCVKYFGEIRSYSITVELAEAGLLALYFFKLRYMIEPRLTMPILSGFMFLSCLTSIISCEFLSWLDIIVIVIVTIAIYVLAVIAIVKGVSCKATLCALAVASFILEFEGTREVLSLGYWDDWWYWNWDIPYILLLWSIDASRIAMVILYGTIFLYGWNEKIPSVKTSITNMSDERGLNFLKKSLDLGEITEEEYNAKRTEIISKL